MNPNTTAHQESRDYELAVPSWPGIALLAAAILLGVVSLLQQLLR